MDCLKNFFKSRENKLLIYTMSGVGLGVILGFAMREANFTPLQKYYWGFPGEVLIMNMLKSIIIPIITLSILTGIADLAGTSGKLASYAVIYYLVTTIISIIFGIVMSEIVKPGNGLVSSISAPKKPQKVVDGLLDIVRNMIAPNVVSAMFQQASTTRNDADTNVVTTWSGPKPTQNVLGLIMMFGTFGYMLGKLKHKGNKEATSALAVLNGLNDAVMECVDLVMWIHPIGLVFLISAKIMSVEDPGIWAELGWLIFTTIVAILIHAFIFIPLIYFGITRKNPFLYMKGVLQALVTAFGTASSAATLPITLRNLEGNNKIDKRVTRFMIPLGATINMDGTALYEAVAALFLARLSNIPLNFGKVIVIAITATAASIGAAAVPSAGLITLIMVLGAVGIPLDNIAWIYTVDWFLDRFRTATNVWGDCVGAGCVQHLCQKELDDGAKDADLMEADRV